VDEAEDRALIMLLQKNSRTFCSKSAREKDGSSDFIRKTRLRALW